MTDALAVVKIENLTKRYGDFTALDGLTLQLHRGQILGLIGHNGAGKSTAIRILVGQSRPTFGAASIAGHDCQRDFRKIKRMVGYMPDVFGSYDNMRVSEYLDFFGAAFGIARKQRSGRVAEVLEMTGAAPWRDRFVESLSHGMKQRVAVARTLMHDPEVLILDEPANGLDPQARVEMRQLLRKLADQGKTLIVSSHILSELARVCDVAAILVRGRLRAFGTVDEILEQLKQRRMFEAQFADQGMIELASQIIADWLEGETEISASEGERVIRFHTTSSDQQMGGLLEKLTAAKTGVQQFREVEADLEEAFMLITDAPADPAPTPLPDAPCSA